MILSTLHFLKMVKLARFQVTVDVNKLLSFLNHSACAGPTIKGRNCVLIPYNPGEH